MDFCVLGDLCASGALIVKGGFYRKRDFIA